ncbi:MAG: hypothetical protein LBP68_00765, partial [Acidobacteriota bacterium]|nr:hypothetical protein [Acidobacteriota bacterium]
VGEKLLHVPLQLIRIRPFRPVSRHHSHTFPITNPPALLKSGDHSTRIRADDIKEYGVALPKKQPMHPKYFPDTVGAHTSMPTFLWMANRARQGFFTHNC